METQAIIDRVVELCHEAGEAIMKIRESGKLEKETKEGGSPVTAADLEANKILSEGLDGLVPDTAVVSEETEDSKPTGDYWLIDPLDGTSDYVKGRNNFAVMVALMRDQKPVLGIVYAPAKDELYVGGSLLGRSYRVDEEGQQDIQVTEAPHTPLRIAASKSHMHEKTKEHLESLTDEYELLSIGSGLKFCYVADGLIDEYVRFQGTMEWDTAAPEAILDTAGGEIVWEDASHHYGKSPRQNKGFIARPKK